MFLYFEDEPACSFDEFHMPGIQMPLVCPQAAFAPLEEDQMTQRDQHVRYCKEEKTTATPCRPAASRWKV